MEVNITNMQMQDKVDQLNKDEVIRLIPMLMFLLLISVIGIPGNGLVCYVYRTKYTMSSSRWFIFFLASADMVLCVFIVPAEIASSMYQYNFTNGVACKLTAFLNTWALLALGFTLVIVSIDRYRKVCRPLGWQIDFKKARILSAVAVGLGFIIPLPLCWIYGIHKHKLTVYNVLVSECSFKGSSTNSQFAFYYVMFGMLLFTSALTTICVLYCFIGKDIKRHLHKEQVRRQVSLSASMAQRGAIRTSVSPRNIITSMTNGDVLRSIKRKTRRKTRGEGQIKSEPVPSLPVADSSVSNELDEQISTNNLTDGDTYDFEMTPPPTKPLERKKTKRIRRARARKATSSMFLISLAFVLSYLPMLALLLLRSVDPKFETGLTDAGRAAYKFFLRSYFLNCSINPFIYGLSDSRFRANCKDVLGKLLSGLNCKRNSYSV